MGCSSQLQMQLCWLDFENHLTPVCSFALDSDILTVFVAYVVDPTCIAVHRTLSPVFWLHFNELPEYASQCASVRRLFSLITHFAVFRVTSDVFFSCYKILRL